jgi:hypothetical protein
VQHESQSKVPLEDAQFTTSAEAAPEWFANGPKTCAGDRDVELTIAAMAGLVAQKTASSSAKTISGPRLRSRMQSDRRREASPRDIERPTSANITRFDRTYASGLSLA